MARPKIFQIPAILEGVSPLKDGGLSLRFHTNEIADTRQKTKVLNFYNTFGWLQFSDKTIHTVPKASPVRDDGGKSPSQRLRAVMFLDWKNSGATDTPFDTWYEQQMERHINYHKGRLPD